jgi:hypothetical protein
MYSARGHILKATGRTRLDDQYFTQVLLPDYLEHHPDLTWDVVFDARGHLREPHTEVTVPLGTLAVREYLRDVALHTWGTNLSIALAGGTVSVRFPTKGPTHRYGAILFIEKETFLPLFDAVQLSARFDIAIMSSKGVSSTACRQLVDDLCRREGGVPLYVLHDFDKAGLTILSMFTRDTRRYRYAVPPHVIDLGLRLEDVKQWGLDAEPVSYGNSNPRPNLRQNGASKEEIDFLLSERVELNAFSSPQLVEWIEGKLAAHKVEKVVPDAEVLNAAYRRALGLQIFESRTADLVNEITDEVTAVAVPTDLEQRVKELITASPALAWDEAVKRIVANADDPFGIPSKP